MDFDVIFTGPKMQDEHRKFIESHHYSKTARSQKETHVFELRLKGTLIGIALYGQPIGRLANQRYGGNVVELRRFCLVDDLPKNTASWFLSRTLKALKTVSGYDKVLSYSDPNQGHVGTIYKASNFRYEGKEKNQNPAMVIYKGEKYHMREVYQKRDGKYTLKASLILKALRSNKAVKIKLLKKDIFLYDIRR